MTVAARRRPLPLTRRHDVFDSLRRGVRAAPPAIVCLIVGAATVGAIHGAFKDLSVYQFAGRLVLDRTPLYDARDPTYGLHFTYPPFAAVLMAPLAHVPAWLAAALWTGASMGALATAVVVARRAIGRETPAWSAALIAIGALALLPETHGRSFAPVE
jgi:alpha-1,2-mannosyltransferase